MIHFLARGLSAGGIFAALAAVAPDAEAQQRPDSARRDSVGRTVAPVVIRGVRTPTTVGGASAVTVTMDSLRLPAAALFDDALRSLPFIHVHRNSRGEVELSTRGSDSRQTAVLLDGVPLTLGWDHRSDPSLVPVTGVSRLTIVRGLSSLLHGPNVLGGVIELSLAGDGAAALPAGGTLHATTSLDQLGGHSAALSGGSRLDGGWSARGGLGYRDRPGLARSGSLVEPGLDPDLRTNSDARETDLFGALAWQADDGRRLSLTVTGYDATRGVPPELHVAEPRLWRYPQQRRALVALSGRSATVATPAGFGSVTVGLGYTVGRTRIQRFDTPAYALVTGRERGDERVATGRVQAEHTLGSRGTLRAAVTGTDIRYDERLDDDPANRYEQRLWSAGSEASWSLAPSTQLSGGLVFDGADTPRSGDKPPLGTLTAWGGRAGFTQLVNSGRVRLHGSLSRRSRFPALRELYSGALGRFDPNPELRPERLLAGELGATTTLAGAELQAVMFHHRLSDAIVRVAGAGRLQRRVNRDQIRSTGLELLGTWRGAGGTELLGDLLWQDVVVRDQSADASRRPENQPELRFGLGVGAPIGGGVRAMAGAHYTGVQYCVNSDTGADDRLDGQLRADGSLERSWRLGGVRAASRLLTRLAAENLADRVVYDQCGLPQPGRTVRLTVGWQW